MNSERDGGGIKSKKMIRRELPLVNFFTKPEEGIRKVPGKEEVMKVLNEVFKIEKFRDNQEDIVMEALNGRDCFVIMPTGCGKSLTYQLPAVMSRGITLVISPLISLIQNQVKYLCEKGINAGAINCKTPIFERRQLIEDISSFSPRTKLLYITPELLSKKYMKYILHNANSLKNVQRLVVDEAHCISEWGHNFRSDYRKLAWIRKELNVPITALTATARIDVRKDISKQLNLSSDYRLFAVSPARHSLYYEVVFKLPNISYQYEIIKIIKKLYDNHDPATERPSVIVYCSTKAECDYLAEALQSHDVKSSPYHSDLSSKDRENALNNWLNNNVHNPNAIDAMIATIAFGMGIDKPNVRLVIHCDLPKSLEAYCQESGRAGRDGLFARSIIFYSRSDKERILWLIKSQKNSQSSLDSFKTIVDYCEETNICRHKFLSDYFDGLTHDIGHYRSIAKSSFCINHNCDRCHDQIDLVSRKHEYERSIGVLVPSTVSCSPTSTSTPIVPPSKILSASNLYKKILDNRKRKRDLSNSDAPS